jgi:GntR family transcriptional regulator / MocR family aminotransferase
VIRKRTSRQPEVLLPLARREGGALHIQIECGLRGAVRSGRLAAGAALPSTRALARDLGVSRGVVVEAYAQLVAEGFVATRQGARTVVATGGRAHHLEPATPQAQPPRFDFRPGQPELRQFPREEWARAARSVLRRLRPQQLGYGEPAGTIELRQALAEYLSRVRGVQTRQRQVIVCVGFAQALGVAARTLARRGVRRVAVEDPGQPDTRRLLAEAGLAPVPVPVDGRGLRVDQLEPAKVQAALVTPAHQFPSGCVLDPERRRELVGWAERRGAFLLEDDYDAEYRYDRQPVGALQGLAPARVVYAGSASKILAPALRLGWLVVPDELLAEAAEVKKYTDLGTPFLEQLVYAEMLRRGAVDRHLRRMRVIYRRRRGALLGALAHHLPRWEPHGAAAGLHVMVLLPPGVDEATVGHAAARQSVRVYPSAHYRVDAGPAALVLGYGCLGERQIVEGISRLATELSQQR